MKIDFRKSNGIIPAIIQEDKSGDVLMLGYMNNEALQETLKTGWVTFWSRSKKRLWMKGEQSGNRLKIKDIFVDCDEDTILIKAELVGTNVCHTGSKTCFFKEVI